MIVFAISFSMIGGSDINHSIEHLDHNALINNRYRIIERLGEGGYGTVYKAADTFLGDRLVAVKEMSQAGLDASETAEAIESFKQEALLLAQLLHPNLPRIYDHFTYSGRWYLVTDFIDGQTLEHFLNKADAQQFSLEQILDIGIQLSTVLDYLHKRQPPIIFRDLKPSNVMLTSDGQVYLIDFGIARHFKTGQAKDTVALGTVGYAAPEQFGKSQTTSRTDIYGFGALLHYLLTGNDPSLSPFRFAPIRPIRKSTPLALEELIFQMVDVDENKRPVSAAAIKQQLQLIANRQISKKGGLSVQRPMPSSRAPAVSEMTRLSIYSGHSSEVHNVVWSPDGKSITSVSQDGIMQVWDAITAKTFFTYTGLRAQIYAVSVLINRKFAIAMSLDKTIQVLLNLDVSQSSMIYAPRRSSGGNLITYSGHSDTVQAITWSPNGKYIASGGNDKTVQVWDAISRQKVSIYTGHSQPIHAIAWSPDGTSIASGSSDALVQIWDSTEGDTILSYQKHSAQLTAIAWSPDGASIASGSHDRIMHIWNAPTGNTTLIYSGHPEGIHAIAWSPDGKYVASASSSVHLLEVATGKVIGVYSGHAGRVNAIAWSKDGRYVASAGNDKTVHVWRVKVK